MSQIRGSRLYTHLTDFPLRASMTHPRVLPKGVEGAGSTVTFRKIISASVAAVGVDQVGDVTVGTWAP